MNWDDLRYFLAVASAGSLSGASHQLDVNTTTVLRRIASLEEDLGARLFDRERTGYRLTQDGDRLLETLDPVERKLTSLSRDFKAAQPGGGGTVRLAVGEVLAAKIIAPSLGAFRERYPHLELDVMADAAAVGGGIAPRVAVPLKDVDMAIRAARPTQGDMIMRKLGDLAYGLYGSKVYLKQHGHPQDLSDLAGHSLIGFSRNDPPFGPIWWMSRAEKVGEISFRSSSAAARARAAHDGNGLTVLPCILGDPDPEMDRVFGPDVVGSLELWLLTRNDLAQQAHVRAVMEFMVEVIRRARGELEGDPRRLTELPPK